MEKNMINQVPISQYYDGELTEGQNMTVLGDVKDLLAFIASAFLSLAFNNFFINWFTIITFGDSSNSKIFF